MVLDENLLKSLPSVAQAAFNHRARQHDPLCLHNTRVNVLEEITTWADGHDGPCMFWLNGMAGTGKSTIARTISSTFARKERLGASFFFSRGGGDLSNAGKVITTLASQLSKVSSTLKRCICKAVKQHPDIAEKNLHDQWRQLIIQPLSKLKTNSIQSPLIFVLDALDECDDDKDMQQILQLLAEGQTLGAVKLRILVTSRLETPIRLGFCDMSEILHHDLVLHNVPREIIDRDIDIYLWQELKYVEVSEQDIKRLIEKACGLFIWAATACRFVKSGKRVASTRLSIVLKGGTSTRNPEKELDDIYSRIISDSISGEYNEDEKEELFAYFRSVVGAIVTLFNPLSAEGLAKLLNKPGIYVKQTLDDLHSVLDIPKAQELPIRLLHPSLRDFLLTKERCQDPRLWVGEKQVHWDLAKSCLQLMSNSLKKDICDLRSPGALASQVNGSRVDQHIPAELQYACRYWVLHIQRSETCLHHGDQTHQFLQRHFLHWLEALSLIGKVSDSIRMVNDLESLVVSDLTRCLFYIY